MRIRPRGAGCEPFRLAGLRPVLPCRGSFAETGVFLQSTLLLLRYQAHHPVKRILAGVRIPAAELSDGRIAVFGAFDAVQWTTEVAAYEHDLRQALPIKGARELWITGSVSPRARAALEERGWVVHAKGDTEPSERLAPAAAG